MSSTYDIQHNKMFNDLELALKKDLSKLTSAANGGRSILFVYPPEDEDKYIEEAQKRFDDKFIFIDLRQLFVEFIDSMGWGDFAEGYKQDKTDMFKSSSYPEDDFIHLILKKIKEVIDSGHNPALIHTGSIYGMDFTNIDYMEDESVMFSPHPMVVFYPGTFDEKGNIMFLNVQKASKYRCIVVPKN